MRLSMTQVKRFARCPYSYYLYYKEGIKIGGGINLVVGKAIHKGFEIAIKSIKTLGSFNMNEVEGGIYNEFYNLIEKGEHGDATEEQIDEGKKRLEIGLEAFNIYKFPQQRDIIAVEERFISPDLIKNNEIVGYPDLITVDAVIDFKTKFRTPSEVDKGDFFQVGYYATFGNSDKAILVYVVLLKRGVKIIEREFVGKELEQAKTLAKHVLQTVDTGIKEAEISGIWIPSGFATGVCSWCEYAKHGLCEYGCGGKIPLKQGGNYE